jgi:hypothetical protein
MSALFPHQGRGTHISLVFREMWDTTAPSLCYSIHPMRLAVNIGGIPHLAKNQRDMGHPALVRGPKEKGTAFHSRLIARIPGLKSETWGTLGFCGLIVQFNGERLLNRSRLLFARADTYQADSVKGGFAGILRWRAPEGNYGGVLWLKMVVQLQIGLDQDRSSTRLHQFL